MATKNEINKYKSYPYTGEMTKSQQQVMIIQADANGSKVECKWLEGSMWLQLGNINGGHIFNFQDMVYRIANDSTNPNTTEPYYTVYNLEK